MWSVWYHSWTGMLTVAIRTSLIASDTMNVLVTVLRRRSAITAATISPFPPRQTVLRATIRPILAFPQTISTQKLILLLNSTFLSQNVSTPSHIRGAVFETIRHVLGYSLGFRFEAIFAASV